MANPSALKYVAIDNSSADPEGRTTSHTYDLNGNKTSTTDGTGAATTLEYNKIDILVKVTDPEGNTVTYSYDSAGRRTSMTDPKGEVTTYTYDSASRLLSETNPLGETTSFTYDAAGRITTKTDGEGTTTYTYDQNGNLTQASYPGGLTETASYDRNNRPTGQSGEGVTLSMSYDPAGRMLSASNGTATTTATYDEVGNITNKTLTRPGGEDSFSYDYDPLGRMTEATHDSQITTYTYDPSGRMISKTYPNGIETLYSFDGSGALSSLDVAKASVPIKTYQVARDARANVTSVTEDGTQTTTYAYDASSRLTGENNPWTGNTTYTYDESGNRLTKEKQGDTPLTYTYNPADQLTEESEGNSYTYNTRGDLTKIENGPYTEEYAWDGKGRLTGVTDTEDNSTSYSYDPRDRTFTSSENDQVQAHIYDMTTDMEIALLDGELNLSSLNHAGTDGLISSTTGDTTSYFSYNPHSDVSLITDESGETTASLHYDAWGNTAEETDEPFNYLGKHQRRTYRSPGLIKMGARFYDPETGRFISRDPLQGEDEVPISRNPYVYANDDPVNMVDLNGMAAKSCNNPLRCVRTESVEPVGGTHQVWVRNTISFERDPNRTDYLRIRYCGWRVRDWEAMYGPYEKSIYGIHIQITSGGRYEQITEQRGLKIPRWKGDDPMDNKYRAGGVSYPSDWEKATSRKIWKSYPEDDVEIIATIAIRVEQQAYAWAPVYIDQEKVWTGASLLRESKPY
ncbi:MAG: hypothetical protein L6427_12840 [Actinomycetia bacterium]|nr:hypothetical protein [Actinomycetes bacterium]